MHSCTGAPVFYSSYANKMKKMIDLISPFLFFVIVNAAVSSGMEALWTWYLQDRILAAAGPAYGWTVLHFWSLLSIAVPPGIGCLAVRKDLLRELYRFREDYENRKLEDVENGKTGRLSPDKEGRRFSLLLCSAVLLSLGLNSLISMTPGGSVSSLNGELAGPAQLLSAALVYGLMMPLIEEYEVSVNVEGGGNHAAMYIKGELFASMKRRGWKFDDYTGDIEGFCAKPCFKILFRTTPEVEQMIRKMIPEKYGDRFQCVGTFPGTVEVMDKNITKGSGLEKFAKANGIDMKDIIAFGDNENDNSLLEAAGWGVCLANGSDGTKAVADDVTELDCFAGGAGDYLIEKYLKPKGLWNE